MKRTFPSAMLVRPVKQREEIARQAFTDARQEVEAVESNIRHLQRALATQNERARRTLLDAREAASLTLYRRCVCDIACALAGEKRRLGQANEALSKYRDDLIEAMKQRKAMDLLVQRQLAIENMVHQREQGREADHLHNARMAWRMEIGSPQLEEQSL